MKKLITRFFQFICILLLSGVGHVSAQAYFQASNSYKHDLEYTLVLIPHHSGLTYHRTTSHHAKPFSQFEMAFLENREEDESASHKKHLEGAKKYTILDSPQFSKYDQLLEKWILSADFYNSPTAVKPHVLYGVFRI